MPFMLKLLVNICMGLYIKGSEIDLTNKSTKRFFIKGDTSLNEIILKYLVIKSVSCFKYS